MNVLKKTLIITAAAAAFYACSKPNNGPSAEELAAKKELQEQKQKQEQERKEAEKQEQARKEKEAEFKIYRDSALYFWAPKISQYGIFKLDGALAVGLDSLTAYNQAAKSGAAQPNVQAHAMYPDVLGVIRTSDKAIQLRSELER